VITWKIKPKQSIVELDPQALLTIGTHIVKKRCCIIMMSGEHLGPWVSCFTRNDMA